MNTTHPYETLDFAVKAVRYGINTHDAHKVKHWNKILHDRCQTESGKLTSIFLGAVVSEYIMSFNWLPPETLSELHAIVDDLLMYEA